MSIKNRGVDFNIGTPTFVVEPYSVGVVGAAGVCGVSGVAGVCPGQLCVGAFPSVKYSVRFEHPSPLASRPVFVQIVLRCIAFGISKSLDSYSNVS